jgi:hypothetical protein
LEGARIFFAVLLGLSAIAAVLLAHAAPRPARRYQRLACALFAAPAAALLLAFPVPSFGVAAFAVLLLATSLAPMALALAMQAAFAAPPSRATTALLLLCAFLAGLGAILSGYVLPASVMLIIADLLIVVIALRHARGLARLEALLAALVFALGAFAAMKAGLEALLFFAAGLMGITLALARASGPVVEQARDLRQLAAIGR